jgi:hypothetical protein
VVAELGVELHAASVIAAAPSTANVVIRRDLALGDWAFGGAMRLPGLCTGMGTLLSYVWEKFGL